MGDLLMGLIVGFVAAVILMSFVLFVVTRRLGLSHEDELSRSDEAINDLRQERADDKETNRRLRHELVSLSPDRLIETATNAEFERDTAVAERDQALEQAHHLNQDLGVATRRLADREAKLRQYREALKEIRIALEAQDRDRGVAAAASDLIDTDTDEVPAEMLVQIEPEPPTPPLDLQAQIPQQAQMPQHVEPQPEPADVTFSE